MPPIWHDTAYVDSYFWTDTMEILPRPHACWDPQIPMAPLNAGLNVPFQCEKAERSASKNFRQVKHSL